jgi:hypothetical protein
MTTTAISIDLLDVFQKGMREILPDDLSGKILDNSKSIGIMTLQSAERAIAEFGSVSASGLFFRSGSAAFKHIVRYHGKNIGIDNLEFRLQPQRARLQDGIEKLIRQLQGWNAANFTYKRSGDAMEVCILPVDEKEKSARLLVWLHFFAGVFLEFLYWAGGGKQYPFQVKPSPEGDALVIYFQLLPVD